MRRLALVFSALAALLLVVSATSGCQKIRMQFQLKTTVSEADPGTPEWLILEAISAAQEPDEPTGWKRFKALLHSHELESLANTKEWRTLRYASFRRKVYLYTEDDSKPTYQLRYYDEQDDGALRYFIENEGNPEMPAPCRFRKDPKADHAWRIYNCSL